MIRTMITGFRLPSFAQLAQSVHQLLYKTHEEEIQTLINNSQQDVTIDTTKDANNPIRIYTMYCATPFKVIHISRKKYLDGNVAISTVCSTYESMERNGKHIIMMPQDAVHSDAENIYISETVEQISINRL